MMSRLQMMAVLSILLASLSSDEEAAAWDQDWSDEVTGETTTAYACPWHSDGNSQLSRQRYYNREVLYRLDVVPCRGIELPKENKALHYRASVWPWYSYWQCFMCIATKLPNSAGSMNHEDMSYNIRSLGHIEGNNYPSQLLSFYHIKCPNNRKVQILIREIRLQEHVRVYNNTKACVDYVKIMDDSTTREYCGNADHSEYDTHLYESQVLITFRSSKYNSYQGFHIDAHCTNIT